MAASWVWTWLVIHLCLWRLSCRECSDEDIIAYPKGKPIGLLTGSNGESQEITASDSIYQLLVVSVLFSGVEASQPGDRDFLSPGCQDREIVQESMWRNIKYSLVPRRMLKWLVLDLSPKPSKFLLNLNNSYSENVQYIFLEGGIKALDSKVSNAIEQAIQKEQGNLALVWMSPGKVYLPSYFSFLQATAPALQNGVLGISRMGMSVYNIDADGAIDSMDKIIDGGCRQLEENEKDLNGVWNNYRCEWTIVLRAGTRDMKSFCGSEDTSKIVGSSDLFTSLMSKVLGCKNSEHVKNLGMVQVGDDGPLVIAMPDTGTPQLVASKNFFGETVQNSCPTASFRIMALNNIQSMIRPVCSEDDKEDTMIQMPNFRWNPRGNWLSAVKAS